MAKTTPRHTVPVGNNYPGFQRPEQQKKKSTSTLLIVLIALMVILIVLLCVFLFIGNGTNTTDTHSAIHDTVIMQQTVEKPTTPTPDTASTAEAPSSSQIGTLTGNFSTGEGSWPVVITLHRSGGRITSATYRNVQYKVTLKMNVSTDDSESYLNMSCPTQDFSISLTRTGSNTYSGSAQSGSKILNASFTGK